MIANRMKRTLSLAVVTAMIVMLTGVGGAQAATAPIKEVPLSYIGWEVDKTTKEKICTVASKDKCQPGKPSSEPGGFEYPRGVVVASNGKVYVADQNNNRVQEFTSNGEFVLMFGKKVNAMTGGNVCTQEEIETKSVKCQAGEAGTEAGAFSDPSAVAVDPLSGNVYVAEPSVNERVDKYTSTGQFVLMIGKEVNETKDNTPGATAAEKNLCAVSVDVCKSGVGVLGATEPGAFVAPAVLAVGGPEDLLYVGDEHRVQEFQANGKYKREIPLTSISSEPRNSVTSLAIDEASDLYLVYTVVCVECGVESGVEHANVIREFDPSGKEIKKFAVLPRESNAGNAKVFIGSIALDSIGRLAVTEVETGNIVRSRGAFYGVGTADLHLITEFAIPFSSGIAFNGKDKLYATADAGAGAGHEVIAYIPVSVGELLSTPEECAPGVEHETSVTFACSLNGEVDPWGVKETQIWFEWGRTPSFGEKTKLQPITNEKSGGEEEEALVKVSAPIEGLRPNEHFYYQLAGEDQNVKTPEKLMSERASFDTPTVPPKIAGEPSASFVKSSSVIMFGELNPENASTKYEFQYAACKNIEENCSGMAETVALKSSVYGKIGAKLEARGLQPGTAYSYRLFAVNEKGELAVNERDEPQLPQRTFTTAPAPVPQALTASASMITFTNAVVSGTVDPDGQSATYMFELGVYAGAATQYGVVFSGPAGASSVPVEESLALTGLQPGTTYAYRIAIKSGYVKGESHTLQGTPLTFTTAGLPSVLPEPTVLAQLQIPNIAFPKGPAKVTPKKLTRAQELALALKACTKKVRHVNRKKCEKEARARYGPRRKKAVRKK